MNSFDPLPAPPRKVKLRSSWMKGQIALWVFAIGIIIGGPTACNRGVGRLENLRDSGEVVFGKVVNASKSSGRNTNYFLTIQFESHGQPVSAHESVSPDLYRAYPFGSEIPVTLSSKDSNDYEFGMVTDANVSDERNLWIGLTCFSGLVVLIFITLTTKEILNEQRLLRRGLVAVAKVVSVRFVKGRAPSTEVTYRFSTQQGERVVTSSAAGAFPTKFTEGGDIQILYLPENEFKARPLAMIRTSDVV